MSKNSHESDPLVRRDVIVWDYGPSGDAQLAEMFEHNVPLTASDGDYTHKLEVFEKEILAKAPSMQEALPRIIRMLLADTTTASSPDMDARRARLLLLQEKYPIS